ncbi:hypothetical protein C9993_08825 [Marinobacter sp. Z-F4-2]|nr:hypothetical protein C9993_08825 [Marinobacter sp. Z-F4-2]
MARPLIAGRGHRDLSLYRNFILNDHRWSSNTSKSAHKQKRTFEVAPAHSTVYALALLETRTVDAYVLGLCDLIARGLQGVR